jgi:hypothetical protein
MNFKIKMQVKKKHMIKYYFFVVKLNWKVIVLE